MGSYVARGGEFDRDTDYITTRITADGTSGQHIEAGRYRLIVAVGLRAGPVHHPRVR